MGIFILLTLLVQCVVRNIGQELLTTTPIPKTDEEFLTTTVEPSSSIIAVTILNENPKTIPVGVATTNSNNIMGPFSVDILKIYVPIGIGNAVQIVWGSENEENNKLNLTYNVYYDKISEKLLYPKLTTSNSSILVEDLEFCTKYHFAITASEPINSEAEERPTKAIINANTIRDIITEAEPKESPKNVTIDLQARAHPCLNIKWLAACPNVVTPIGYVISILDKITSKYNVITTPKTINSDQLYKLPVQYGDSYEIRISTTFPGSKASKSLLYNVPKPLQPYKVKISVNQEDGAFLVYWSEPFVPLSVGRYYYQVFVYPGQDLEAPYEKYYVTRPVIVYKSDLGEYTFCISFATYDRKYISEVTQPLYGNSNGESYFLNETFSATPDK